MGIINKLFGSKKDKQDVNDGAQSVEDLYLGEHTMKFEWLIEVTNRPLDDALPFIQKCLLDENITNFTVDLCGISVPSSNNDRGMEFIISDGHLYHFNYIGEGIVKRIRQTLEENGFDIIVEEL